MSKKRGTALLIIITLIISTLGSNAVIGAQNHAKSNDSLARLYEETGNEAYYDEIISSQNDDGGFGLTEQYQSDILDTLLVYEALVHQNAADGEHSDKINEIMAYMLEHQNSDGGWSYTGQMESDDLLTLKAVVVTLAYERFGTGYKENGLLTSAKAFIESGEYDFSKEDFVKKMYLEMYYALTREEYEPDAVLAELAKIKDESESYYQNAEATKAAKKYIRLVEELQKPYLSFKGMETVLSEYVAYDGVENTINVVSDIEYKTNSRYQADVIIRLICDEKEIQQVTSQIVMDKQSSNVTAEGELVFDAHIDSSYRIVVEVRSGESLLGSEINEINVKKVETDDLILQSPINTENGVELTWNNISNDFVRYGYRIYRTALDGQWETRSSWDGSEKVRVLNIYPCEAARENLRNWMTSNLEGEEIPAGKGLFEIDVVNIDNYNMTPEEYLKDDEGNYKYDVLYFGAYDCNGNKDLNEKSYQATQDFIDSGRGVLFGHDTVCMAYYARHPIFAQFADQMGIKVKSGSLVVRDTRVKVVNTGVLTSYPWKIEGVLDIPTTHNYHQYTGGTLTATVWLEFVSESFTDEETGGNSNAYLFSKNQLAMIQTGDSNGKATDDERKVIANTLFYLKQLSDNTEITDASAYDTKAPGICAVENVEATEGSISLDVTAVDEGTTYRYYVEAMAQADDSENMNKTSNIVETTVVSGIGKYEYYISESEETDEEAEWSSAAVNDEGRITIETGGLEADREYYIHIRAVDCHGNAGGITTVNVSLKQKPEEAECSLFGSEGIVAYCNELKSADVYSGGDFTFAGSALTVAGKCEAVGRINAYTGNAVFTERTEGAQSRIMPQLHDVITAGFNEACETDILNIYNSTMIDKPTYCNTTTGAYCPELVMNEMLICENAINMGAGSVQCNTLYSVNGDININASVLSGTGIIYAPNGTVNINVSELKYTGRIIAKSINIQGSYITIEKE